MQATKCQGSCNYYIHMYQYNHYVQLPHLPSEFISGSSGDVCLYEIADELVCLVPQTSTSIEASLDCSRSAY